MAFALIGAVIAFWLAATGYLGRVLVVLGLLLLAILYYDSITWAWVTVSTMAALPLAIAVFIRPSRFGGAR